MRCVWNKKSYRKMRNQFDTYHLILFSFIRLILVFSNAQNDRPLCCCNHWIRVCDCLFVSLCAYVITVWPPYVWSLHHNSSHLILSSIFIIKPSLSVSNFNRSKIFAPHRSVIRCRCYLCFCCSLHLMLDNSRTKIVSKHPSLCVLVRIRVSSLFWWLGFIVHLRRKKKRDSSAASLTLFWPWCVIFYMN